MTQAILPGCEPYSYSGAALGVLVLHGFTGNPASLRSLAETMARAGFSVELPRLPGHGTSVEDMMETDWSDWSNAALAAYDVLSEHCERVAVVGLSMGGGLAAKVAEEREVAGCVFINPLVRPANAEILDGIDQLLEAGLEMVDSIGSDIKKPDTLEASYPVTPLACARSLFQGIAQVHARLGSITAPSLLLSSREDHVVTSDNGDDLMAMVSGPVERVWLEDSYHVATLDNEQEAVEAAALAFVQKVLA